MEAQPFSQDRKLIKAGVLFLIVVSVFFAVRIINEIRSSKYIGGTSYPETTINVSGEGEVFAVPDIAQFSFSVVEENLLVEEAQKGNAEKMNTILAYLEEVGIEEKDIKTTSYNLYPRYEYKQQQVECFRAPCPPQNTRVLSGYEVRQSVSVKVRDTSEAGAVISGAGERGATNVSGVNFTIDDESELKREARELAINNAKQKAKELAQDLGVDLVRIVSFNEHGAEPFYRAYAEDSFLTEGLGGGAPVAPELPVGENRIVSNVNITYEIK